MPVIEDWRELKPKPERDVLLIVGDGWNVLQDIEEWYKMAEGVVEYDTMGVNYSPMVIPHPIQHFAAGDAHMKDMQGIAKSLPRGVIKHAWNPGSGGVDVRWIRNGRGGWNGTSANLAFKVGLALDYTRIVLAGCPMDNGGNWYKSILPPEDIKVNKDHRHHMWKWQEIACRPVGRFVKSMSGSTAEILGKPSREWLQHLPEIPEEGEKSWKSQN